MSMAGSKPAQTSQRAGLLPASLSVAFIVAAGLALRLGRLAWQPLWWDEGYSVYFATEPLARMLSLTARDIHPPLYYALLHAWIGVFGSGPVALRLLSVVIGALSVAAIAWLARILFPQRTRTVWIAALLLAVNPTHVYYTQEVRMYALAMLLGMAATGWLWRAVSQLAVARAARNELIYYALFGALSLYTLYYTALLLAAQALWAFWLLRRTPRGWRALLATYAAIFVAYMPWLIYALPKLLAYVGQKIGADADRPLNLLDYALRHGSALLAGHVAPNAPATWAALALSLAALLVLLIPAWRGRTSHIAATSPNPVNALLLFTFLPAAAAFLLNLRLPFFPDGGERLLLFVLPFVLLLLAHAVDASFDRQPAAGAIALGMLVCAGLLGLFVYYTTPRYSQDDYRPVIAQAVQQGAPGDTFLATFPWMVGYWRAYAPAEVTGPKTLLLGDSVVRFGPGVGAALDDTLAHGTLWFPEPLGFGSDLPGEIEAHLRATSLNVENRWVSLTTRLSAWAAPHQSVAQPLYAQFGAGPLLAAAGVQAEAVSGANAPLALQLEWKSTESAAAQGARVDLRLVDTAGRAWAARSYSPPGAFAADLQVDGTDGTLREFAGLLAPSGTPPGIYTVTVGLSDESGPISAAVEGKLLSAAPIGTVSVTLPLTMPMLAQMPINQVVRRPRVDVGLSIIGASLPETPLLAGTSAALRIAAENLAPTAAQRELFVSLLDAKDSTVADWQGWTLPDFPTALWPQGTRLLVPVEMDLPPTLEAGRHTLVAGWLDLESGERTPPVTLGSVVVERRSASFEPIAAENRFEPAPLIGTHALLEGYSITQTGQSLVIALDWRVEQPLLPPHHIFVHADGTFGGTVAQSDGQPMTAAGAAPTGTWQPGEYVRTIHTLTIPPDTSVSLRVGLYDPATQVRLPVTIAGAPAGDSVTLKTLP